MHSYRSQSEWLLKRKLAAAAIACTISTLSVGAADSEPSSSGTIEPRTDFSRTVHGATASQPASAVSSSTTSAGQAANPTAVSAGTTAQSTASAASSSSVQTPITVPPAATKNGAVDQLTNNQEFKPGAAELSNGTNFGGNEGKTGAGKIIFRPGMELSVNTKTEDITPTDDVELARKQAEAYPDNPEAAFIYAVALTRTSRVEDALKQVRHAKHLAQAKGGATYFDKMIQTYEHMLEYCPKDNQARYTLAWAYYMKAYLLAKTGGHPSPGAPAVSARQQQISSPAGGGAPAGNSAPTTATNAGTVLPAAIAQALLSGESKDGNSAKTPVAKDAPGYVKPKNVNAALASQALASLSPQLAQHLPTDGKISTTQLPHIQGALELAPPPAVPQVKQYYEAALKNLDDLLAQKPDDLWATVYRAHLYAEFTGDLNGAMKVWRACQVQSPQNPAPYFFLGEGYLRQGNLKECLSNISRAVALRALGM